MMYRARCLSLIVAAWSQMVFAHGGGLDAYGCHNNRKAGGYHCHRGVLAGQAFTSKSDMLAKLRAAEAREQAARERERQAARQVDAEERLRKLKDLHEKGLISDEEYAEKRAEILAEL